MRPNLIIQSLLFGLTATFLTGCALDENEYRVYSAEISPSGGIHYEIREIFHGATVRNTTNLVFISDDAENTVLRLYEEPEERVLQLEWLSDKEVKIHIASNIRIIDQFEKWKDIDISVVNDLPEYQY